MLTNQALFDIAQNVIPGGVNSPVRAFGAVGGTPRFMVRGEGAYLWDIEGHRYIDYINSWGPAILGHAHPEVVVAVKEAAAKGLGFGTPTEIEVHMAQEICHLMPAIEQVRLVSSGTEAVMSALRIARAFTRRRRIVKFDGCYHGHADSMLIRAGSGPLTFGNPTSDGVSSSDVGNTIVAEYNHVEAVEAVFAAVGDDIAAVIVEPIAANMNLVRGDQEFLAKLRQLCDRHGAVLIFDEVLSGFRVALGGAQSLYGIQPDLTCLGKVIGGGLPVAAFGGRRDIMMGLAPVGPTYQAGTLSGNPVAVAAGLTTLRLIQQPGFFEMLSNRTGALAKGFSEAASAAGISLRTDYVGGILGLYFADSIPRCLSDVSRLDQERFRLFFHKMLNAGVHFAPSMYEVIFVSSAHDEDVINATLSIAQQVFLAIAAETRRGCLMF